MDGVDLGRRTDGVESMARALEIPWNQDTVEKFTAIQNAFLKKYYADLEAKRAASKR